MYDNETTLAWMAMPYRAPVVAADGSVIGRAESLLGDEDDDIFHGIVIDRNGDGRRVEIAADRIKKITERHVVTDLNSSDVATLHPYREEHWYHLGWGGLFRRRPEWKE